MIISMETATTHEARARNAKAQALATVLHEAGTVPADLETDEFAVGSLAWKLAASLATQRHLLGTGRRVHAPGSQATIDAVARILGDLIAHADEQAQLAAVHGHGPDVMTADLDADTPDAWCDDDDRAEADRDCDHSFGGIWPCALPLGHEGDHNGGWVNGQPPAPRPHADTYERPPARSARDSQGYRSTLARIAPQPETTEADLFAPFAQAVNR